MIYHERYAGIKNVFKRDRDICRLMPGEFSLPEFKYLQDCEWQFTEKLDGTNVRVILDNGIDFRGRSDAAKLPGPLSQHLRDTFDTEVVREQTTLYGEGVCLYGEGIGPRIQSGAKYGSEQRFVLFDATTDCGWASRHDLVGVAVQLHIPIVPVVFEGTLAEGIALVSNGFRSTYGNFFAEGLVGRPLLGLQNCYSERITVKIKHRDFYDKVV